MTLLDVLNTIRQAGGRVVVEDGNLRITAPAGLLTAEHKAVLAEHKVALMPILPSAEREAITWVENLSPDEATVVVETARRQWAEIVGDEPVVVIKAEITGDELRLVCPTPEIRDKIEAGRPIVEKVLAEIRGEILTGDEEEEEIEPPAPCPKCGSWELWQSLAGSWRCFKCDPPIKAEWFAAKAKQLRKKHGVQSQLRRYNDRSRSVSANTGPAPDHKQP